MKLCARPDRRKNNRGLTFSRPQVTDMPLSLTDVLLMPIERPRCGRCRIRMNLSSIMPRPDHSEKRTFECPKCEFVEITVVSDPLKPDEVNRLTDNIRPPA
jgi:hypothetical protein